MSLESEAVTDREARSVLADSLEADGNESLAMWWRSELIEENGSANGYGDGDSDGYGYCYGSGSGDGSGSGYGYGYGSGYGYGYGSG